MHTVSFKTRARTVDHLGREQIADVPTAISELWKNSYDAYARSVSLTIFDETQLVVSITDDGHGMNYEELIDRWLVVGTESKLFEDTRSEIDMDGLKMRSRQGQKGIGRLSSAHLGPIMLLISKRRDQQAAAALIDWRLFENPFLILSDIEIPVVSLASPEDITQRLPEMISALLQNVHGDGTGSEREKRVVSAWANYDHVVVANTTDPSAVRPSQLVLEGCSEFQVLDQHLALWPVWTGLRDHGTAMVVSRATDEFSVFLPANKDLQAADDDRRRFLSTLGGFVDPLFDPMRPDIEAVRPDFDYCVDVYSNGHRTPVISSSDDFNRTLTDQMEHIVDGRIGEDGVFRGQIKSFGKWRKTGSDYVVAPPKDFTLPVGTGSRLGPMDIYIATYEQEPKNSTHTPAEMKRMRDLTENHAGLMIYRDSLRVLPYGREDNDFFEIEKRRSINAGREYWNARRIFGRIAITRNENPNLKDKAGREGFIVNRAAKTLKILVTNILRAAAYDYFGSNSEDRKAETEVTQRNFAEQRARDHQAKLRKSHRTKFRTRLRAHLASIPSVSEQIKHDLESVRIETAEDITSAQEVLEKAQDSVSELRLPGAPSPLGSLEDDYRAYRKSVFDISQLVNGFSERLAEAVERISPKSPQEILAKQIQRNEAQLSSRVTRWAKEIRGLQDGERERIASLISERNKLLRLETSPLVGQVEDERLSLSAAAKAVSAAKARIETENELLFQNYIFALENMRDSIDVQAVAVLGGDENSELRSQVDRLNGLAQLGITVEFLDHEFHAHDAAIVNGLAKLKSDPTDGQALQRVDLGYSGLKQIIDFLGPLRMAGRVRTEVIPGARIYDYVADFFDRVIRDNGIDFTATESFLAFSIYEQQSRLLPVFINLINNSIYWLINSRTSSPRIVLDFRDGEVIVADNGPGIDDIDIKRLFTLFFTRKLEGGRGVGLYLCQANLAAGGHQITYVQDNDKMVLPGANFAIAFRGGNNNG
ncbi:ATP-binding protein [Agrobacterium sp. LMR679]|uniref:ATP-binding protein n=1 Tax=Agrobacterium sp. LMR679 TaxID=3014335 RepID=UPI0022AF9920|nr:ATP-binding protein [Agrobacterium sp. LMR679]MCZ4074949.1 ATP-binding protein [Agrobacterium sp. LMR679]